MIGTPVTYASKFSDGTYGYTIAVDVDNLFMDTISKIQAQSTDDVSLTALFSSESALTDLMAYVNDSACPNCAWYLSSSILYLFFKTSVYAYEAATMFTAFGTRTGIPIRNMDDVIDVPEQFMELYIKYAIREAAQLQGRQVPPSILADIAELETALE